MNATDLKRKYGYYPIGQQLKKIQASDAGASDQFGYSVAVSNNRIVIGAPYEGTYVFDINGNQLAKMQAGGRFGWSVAVSDTRIVVGAYQDIGTGSAYIFDINGNQIANIQASDAEDIDQFGYSVAVSDTRIVVGAPYEDPTAEDAGSAYIFDINGNELAKIQASDPEYFDLFGHSVAVSNNRIVVGAYLEDTTAGGAGSAYIFDINGNQIAKIQASDAQLGDHFGWSVAVSDTRIVVGAFLEDTTAGGAGSAYIFDINGNQIAKIQASDPEVADNFGYSVAVSSNRIVVGSSYEDTTANNAGSAYIFDINGNQIAKIQASDVEADDRFGWSVAVSDTRIVVGVPYEDTTASNAGSAYIFTSGFSPFGDICAYYDLGDPTVLDTNFSWSDTT